VTGDEEKRDEKSKENVSPHRAFVVRTVPVRSSYIRGGHKNLESLPIR
jgi:hypothetical protein